MKLNFRYISIGIVLLLLMAGEGFGATIFTDGSADHKWSTAGNWSAGKPDAADAVTIQAGVTALIIDEAATTAAFTDLAGLTVTGSGNLAVNGDFTSSGTANWSGWTGNLTISSTSIVQFGGKSFPGTTTINAPAVLYDTSANTFANLTIVFAPTGDYVALELRGNQTVSGTLTITGGTSNTVGGAGNIRGRISGWEWTGGPNTGVPRTITAANVVMTGAADFRDIVGAGAASWDLSAAASGNLGGNTGITFRSPTTYYLTCETNDSRQDYQDVWSLADDGTPDGAGVFPLPQDTIVVNNNTWSDTGNSFVWHSGGTAGKINASALTEANNLALPRSIYGDIDYTGAGITIPAGYHVSGEIDARLENDIDASPLTINVLPAAANTNMTISSCSGSVKLLTNGLTTSGTVTLTKGTLDLGGETLNVGILSSSNAFTRAIQDSTGGGKIILNGLTGTIFDTTTATNLTISNAPDIDIGDSNNTLTGDVTFIGSAKAFGDFTVKKHAGNYDCIITGSNTFGALTLETPDVTYQYSDLTLTAGTDQTITSLVSTGTADYKINILSATPGSAATLSDTAGENKVFFTSVTDNTAEGGATWVGEQSTRGSGNTGWTFYGWGTILR